MGRCGSTGPFARALGAAEWLADADADGDADGAALSEGAGSGVGEPGCATLAPVERGCPWVLTARTVVPITTRTSRPISHHLRLIRANPLGIGGPACSVVG